MSKTSDDELTIPELPGDDLTVIVGRSSITFGTGTKYVRADVNSVVHVEDQA